jgi:hypothetical protein
LERHAFAGFFLQCLAIGGNGLFEARGAALAFAERREHIAEIVLGRGPVERHPVADAFLQGLAIGGDGFL